MIDKGLYSSADAWWIIKYEQASQSLFGGNSNILYFHPILGAMIHFYWNCLRAWRCELENAQGLRIFNPCSGYLEETKGSGNPSTKWPEHSKIPRWSIFSDALGSVFGDFGFIFGCLLLFSWCGLFVCPFLGRGVVASWVYDGLLVFFVLRLDVFFTAILDNFFW